MQVSVLLHVGNSIFVQYDTHTYPLSTHTVRVLHFTNFLTVHQKNLDQIYIISGVLSDRYECYSKEYSCLANYSHTHACDNYYTKMYISSHL